MIVRNLIAALREDETVYVNDLGLFQKVFSRAHIEETQAFPPRYSVLLNAEEEGSGYAFILYVSKSENIRIVDADLAIRHWVEQLMEELQKNHSVSIEHFGTFSLKKNKLEFIPASEIPELNAEFEGLEPIEIQKYPKQKHPERTEVLPPFEPIEPVVEPEPIIEPEPIVEPETVVEPDDKGAMHCASTVPESEPESGTDTEDEPEPEPESEPIVEPETVIEPEPIAEAETIVEPDGRDAKSCVSTTASETEQEAESETDTEDEPEPKKHWGWIVFVVAMLAAIGILGWFFKDNLLDFYHQKFDKQPVVTDTTVVETQPEEPVVMDTITESDSTDFVEEEYTEPEPEIKPFDINNLEHINYEKGKFYLVHGSFSQEADCIRHIRSHHFEEYAPKVLHQSGNSRVRVCLGVFSSEEASIQFAESHGLKDAWTLK